ncbi:PAS domain-containing protein [Devosia sp. PTR5]|uniref:histidine kinase n=1 Tax=Devosia oryzisoli TaxID=2774138 RepID=A0A927ISK7_9HYPH|nr:HAMP domain-containing sensor histidine kinase [Devosia oryzisoli]MBD8065584.1 PAS domain-containing protein [Devosia oryzisoli]
MNDRWTTLPSARDVLQHADDTRPAWLWSQDGHELLWSNAAAGLFLAKLKKHGLKRAPLAIPIKGQVARIIRLGTIGRSSLARIQFLAGEKPVSLTCATTPLAWHDGETALLIVGVDPIADEILEAAAAAGADAQAEPEGIDLPAKAEEQRPEPVEPVLPAPQDLDAGLAYSDELESWQAEAAETDADAHPELQPFEPHGNDAPADWQRVLDEAEDAAAASEDVRQERKTEPASRGRLSNLVDRLLQDEDLFTPLGADDDRAPVAPASIEPAEEAPMVGEAAVPAVSDAAQQNESAVQVFYRLTGRAFTPHEDSADASLPAEADKADHAVEPPPEDTHDRESVERVSRYNFDELSRILTDRIGERAQTPLQAPVPSVPQPEAQTSGALVNLGAETLVLNRLPLGILVFRDQQILFANRAITEMVGYDSVESLRGAGLAAVFPAAGPEGQDAGPVNHLVQRDGTLVPVTARLQSISWHGRPALMLSASATEVRTGHEEAVRAFAEGYAELRGEGFVVAGRSGTVSAANAAAADLLTAGKPITGRTLASLVGDEDVLALQAFLERPARFAETERPAVALRSGDGRADIILFALGQAGLLSGYFGFVRARTTPPARINPTQEFDPALLARISRGVRRPLNAIIGFSDLLRAETYGPLGDERYGSYAEDILRAGHEIASLVDELDDYTRLREGRYLPQRTMLDLTSLLEGCVVRIRAQANAARVIVRNAISETLPKITADRPSLIQAVLNLLASAIDQTPTGGTVVISAQKLDDGGIAVHVRDSSLHSVDMAERFVVFRDGSDKTGQALAPVRSSVGLALTRSLLAVNAVSLSVDPAGREGMLFTLKIPPDLVEHKNERSEEQQN